MTTSLIKPFNSIKTDIRAAIDETPKSAFNPIKNLLAGNAGAMSAIFARTTGLSTAIHEVVGHGLLGFKTVFQYAPGQGPNYWVLGWDNFKEMFKAGSFKEWVSDFFQWISASNADEILVVRDINSWSNFQRQSCLKSIIAKQVV